MKFAKILLVMAVLAPSAAVSQQITPPAQPPGVGGGIGGAGGLGGLAATNFALLFPIFSFIAVPLALGEDNNFIPPAPIPNPTPGTN